MGDNLIICVKKKIKDEEPELFPGYSFEETLYEGTNCCCWNCTYLPENGNFKNIPIKFCDGIFYVTGYFCSIGCCYRYIYDNYKDKELWAKYELLSYYFKIIYGEIVDITLPPDKLLLEKFGGNLKIEEYRQNNYNPIIHPPIVVINNIEVLKKEKDNDYLKLYRKKKKKENTILNNMNIE